METVKTTPQEDLRERLSQISYGAVKADPSDLAGVLNLAESLKAWGCEAHRFYGPWTTALQHQTEQVLQGLKSGRPIHQGLERILKAVLSAGKNMTREEEQNGMPVPGTEVLVFGSSSQKKDGGRAEDSSEFLLVKDEDLPGLQDFLQEAPTHFDAIEEGLLRVEQDESWDVLKVYRPFHTLKSLFGYMGFPRLSDLSHQSESLLDRYKRGGGKPTAQEVETLLKVLDLLRAQTSRIREGLGQGRIERCQVPSLFKTSAAGNAPPEQNVVSIPGTPEPQEGEDWFIRIETSKMDALMETLGEWMAFQNQVRMMAMDSSEYAPLSETLDRMGKSARKLQDQVVTLRMVPIQPLFNRVSRVARDLSQKTGKSLRLELAGGDTRLDKRLVDELWEPILHLMRNAVDHGIEDAEERARKGKNPHGGLWIKAWHQEGHFILSIRDDGKGLDIPKIEEKARTLGWLEAGKELEAVEWQDMIFQPGFSTAGKVSDVSGRGIGLDLVRRRLGKLKGTVEVATVHGEGCLFILRIPLTLALLDGLLVRVGKGFYLIPLDQIHHFHQLTNDELRGVRSPLGNQKQIDLADWFAVRSESRKNTVGIFLEADKAPILLLVDEILGKREIILKGLNPILAGLKGINGGTILGDGQVALVLDIPYMVRAYTRLAHGDEINALWPMGRGAA
jgi:two-component system chemotaxis sensor kinase CheA